MFPDHRAPSRGASTLSCCCTCYRTEGPSCGWLPRWAGEKHSGSWLAQGAGSGACLRLGLHPPLGRAPVIPSSKPAGGADSIEGWAGYCGAASRAVSISACKSPAVTYIGSCNERKLSPARRRPSWNRSAKESCCRHFRSLCRPFPIPKRWRQLVCCCTVRSLPEWSRKAGISGDFSPLHLCL